MRYALAGDDVLRAVAGAARRVGHAAGRGRARRARLPRRRRRGDRPRRADRAAAPGRRRARRRAPARGVRGRPHRRRALDPARRARAIGSPSCRADREVVAYCRGPFCAYAHEAVRTPARGGPPRATPRGRLAGMAPIKRRRRPHDAQRLANSTPPSSSSASRACTRRWRSSPSASSTSRPAARWPSGSATRAADLDRIPRRAIDSFAGVGYFLDLAAIAPGEAVLDLGSGSGTDSFLAALRPGRRSRHRRRHDRRAARQGPAPRRRGRLRQRRVPRRATSSVRPSRTGRSTA